MGIKPGFKFVADGEDVTGKIVPALSELKITDVAGMESDKVEIKLSDPRGAIEVPSKGVRLEIIAGYQGNIQSFGEFVVSKIKAAGPPDVLTVTATAAAMNNDTTRGSLKSVRSVTWRDTTLLGIVQVIANRANLTAAIHPSFQDVTVGHLNQLDESDIHFLTRLSRFYDATAKVAGGHLLFVPKDGGEMANGEAMPVIDVRKSDVTNWTYEDMGPSKHKAVVVKYVDPDTQEEKEYRTSAAEPAFIVRSVRESLEEARQIAAKKLKSHSRGTGKLTLNLSGNPDLLAEHKIKATDFRPEVNGEYVIKSVTHVVTKGGYKCSNLVAER